MDADLAALWLEILDRLADAAAVPGHRMRFVTIATTAADSTPRARMVVLRTCATDPLSIDFYTDIRSGKWAEIAANGAVELLAWDPEDRVQLRLTGLGTCHTANATARLAWDGLRVESRNLWRQAQIPGQTIDNPHDAPPLRGDDDAYGDFGVVRLGVERAEYLHLHMSGQLRAAFTAAPDGLRGMWLAP